MHITEKNTVLHDSSNKYQHTGEVVILYKDIKFSLWINTGTQYDNIKFAQLFFFVYHKAIASSKQKTFFFPLHENGLFKIALLSLAFHPYW